MIVKANYLAAKIDDDTPPDEKREIVKMLHQTERDIDFDLERASEYLKSERWPYSLEYIFIDV